MSVGLQIGKLQRVNTGDNVKVVSKSSRVNALQDLSKALIDGTPISKGAGTGRIIGPGYNIQRSRRPRIFAGAKVGKFPWKIISTSLGGAPAVKIYPGTINNALPGNMFDVFPISSEGLFYVYLNIITDGVGITDVAIVVNTAPSPPLTWATNIAPINFTWDLGVVLNGAIYQLSNTLLSATPMQVGTVSKGAPVPGQPLVDYLISWSVSAV